MSTDTIARIMGLDLTPGARTWFLTLLSEGGVVDTFELARDLMPGRFPLLCHELRTAGLAYTNADAMVAAEGWLDL
jgi:hypothetical protein